MKFRALHENLRKVIRKRIDDDQLTGLKLASQTGFQQAHISNFLNSKRSLSLEGMDKVLHVQKLSVLDLLDPAEVNKRASILPPSPDEFEDVLLADATVAANNPLVTNDDVRDILKFKKVFLKRLRSDLVSPRAAWRRFVLIKVDTRDGMSMHPRLLPGSVVLIDRHYNSLEPYRKSEQSLYAVRQENSCTVKYVELVEDTIILRPHNQSYPVSVIKVEAGKTFADYIVGRICHISTEA